MDKSKIRNVDQVDVMKSIRKPMPPTSMPLPPKRRKLQDKIWNREKRKF